MAIAGLFGVDGWCETGGFFCGCEHPTALITGVEWRIGGGGGFENGSLFNPCLGAIRNGSVGEDTTRQSSPKSGGTGLFNGGLGVVYNVRCAVGIAGLFGVGGWCETGGFFCGCEHPTALITSVEWRIGGGGGFETGSLFNPCLGAIRNGSAGGDTTRQSSRKSGGTGQFDAGLGAVGDEFPAIAIAGLFGGEAGIWGKSGRFLWVGAPHSFDTGIE